MHLIFFVTCYPLNLTFFVICYPPKSNELAIETGWFEDCFEFKDIADVVFNDIGDKTWAKKIYDKALKDIKDNHEDTIDPEIREEIERKLLS